MGDHLRRKCLICGRSPSEDPSIKLYRFPNPGPTNVLRCESWAKYCFPDREWSAVPFLRKLYSEHRMLCNKHFKKSSFTDFAEKKLNRHAFPDAVYDADESESGSEMPCVTFGPYAISDVSRLVLPNTTSLTNPNSTKSKAGLICKDDTAGIRDLQTSSTTMDLDHTAPTKHELASFEQIDEPVVIIEDPLEDDDIEHTSPTGLLNYGDADNNVLHEGFRCNKCGVDIRGFRYSCVQCADYDLCGACERDNIHPEHYMLRIPTPKTYAEIQEVMKTIRKKIRILLETKFDDTSDDGDTVKSEVKEEPPDPLVFINAEEPMDSLENIQMADLAENIRKLEEEVENSQHKTDIQGKAHTKDGTPHKRMEPGNVRKVYSRSRIDGNYIRTQTDKGRKVLLVPIPSTQENPSELQNITPTAALRIKPDLNKTKSEKQGQFKPIIIKTKPHIEQNTKINNNKFLITAQLPKHVKTDSTENFMFTIATKDSETSKTSLKNCNVECPNKVIQELENKNRIVIPITAKRKQSKPIILKKNKILRVEPVTQVTGLEFSVNPSAGKIVSSAVKFCRKVIS